MSNEYDNIIHLPHHVSKVHPPMSMYQRAAQFAPFAALTGHDAAIRETARLTDSMIDLDDDDKDLLNRKMAALRNHTKDHPEVIVTFFQPDTRKSGGMYKTYTGKIKDIDNYDQNLVLTDGMKIPLPSILDIDSKLFDNEEM